MYVSSFSSFSLFSLTFLLLALFFLLLFSPLPFPFSLRLLLHTQWYSGDYFWLVAQEWVLSILEDHVWYRGSNDCTQPKHLTGCSPSLQPSLPSFYPVNMMFPLCSLPWRLTRTGCSCIFSGHLASACDKWEILMRGTEEEEY